MDLSLCVQDMAAPRAGHGICWIARAHTSRAVKHKLKLFDFVATHNISEFANWYTASIIPREVRHAQQLQSRFQGGHRGPDAAARQRTHEPHRPGDRHQCHHAADLEAAGSRREVAADTSGGDQTPSLSHKFQIAFESAGLSGEELAAYARARGLQVEQIQGYRRDCLQADALLRDLDSRRRQEISAMQARLRDLEQEQKARTGPSLSSRGAGSPGKKNQCDLENPRTRGRLISVPDRMK